MMKYQIQIKGIIWGVFLSAFLCVNSSADICGIRLNESDFGNLNQYDIPIIGIWGCAPAAAVNSFVYLQNKFPQTYGSTLVPDKDGQVNNYTKDELKDAAITLSGDNYMHTNESSGTTLENFIYGMHNYMKDNAQKTTQFSAVLSYGWTVPYNDKERTQPDWCSTNRSPSGAYLLKQLKDQNIVNLVLASSMMHVVTLTGIQWNDKNKDGKIERDEEGVIYYIDPRTGKKTSSTVWDSNGKLYINYKGIDPQETLLMISGAVSMKPIPLPGGLWLLFSGLLIVVRLKSSRY